MTTFHLKFTPDLKSVSSQNGETFTQQLQEHSSSTASENQHLLATLESIGRSIHELESFVESRLHQIEQQITKMAIETAVAVLNDEEALIQKRVERYVELCFEQLCPATPNIIYVNPACIEPIKRWIAEKEMDSVQIKEDPSLSAGDCRVESDQTGVMATLDAFLELAGGELNATRTQQQDHV